MTFLGFQSLDSSNAANFECEYCFLSLVTGNEKIFQEKSREPVNKDQMLMDHGRIQMEMTCLYEPGINSKCPKIVKEAKLAFSSAAFKNGEKLTQYSNTPSCDENKKYWERYKIKLYL